MQRPVPRVTRAQASRDPKIRLQHRLRGSGDSNVKGANMSTILLIILVLLLVGALPTWPYSSGWGYYPSGGVGLIVVILLVLVLMGRV